MYRHRFNKPHFQPNFSYRTTSVADSTKKKINLITSLKQNEQKMSPLVRLEIDLLINLIKLKTLIPLI
jgi:hypothetical protein